MTVQHVLPFVQHNLTPYSVLVVMRELHKQSSSDARLSSTEAVFPTCSSSKDNMWQS